MMNPTTISPESSSASANHLGLSAKGKKGKSGLQKGLFSRLLVKLQQTAQQEGLNKAGSKNVVKKAVETGGKTIALVSSPAVSKNVSQPKTIAAKAIATNTNISVSKLTKQPNVDAEKVLLTQLHSPVVQGNAVDKKSQILIAAVKSEQSKSSEASADIIASIQNPEIVQQTSLDIKQQADGAVVAFNPNSTGKKQNTLIATQPTLVENNEISSTSPGTKETVFADTLSNKKTLSSTIASKTQNSVVETVKPGINSQAQNSVVEAVKPGINSQAQNSVVEAVKPGMNSQAQNSVVETVKPGMNSQAQNVFNGSVQKQKGTETDTKVSSSASVQAAPVMTEEADDTPRIAGLKTQVSSFEKEVAEKAVRAEKVVVSNDGQQESIKSQQSPIAVLQQRSPNQEGPSSTINASQESQNSLAKRIVENSGASSSQDFTSNQDGSDQMLLDASKAESRPTKGLDFQAQLAYKSQRSFTPADTMLEIVRSAKDGSTSIELQLEPANLGKVHVSIQLDAAKQLQVAFTVEHAASRHALEQQIPQLRLALAQQGLDLGSFNMQMNQQQHGNQQQGSGFAGKANDDDNSLVSTASNIGNNDTRIGVNLATDGHLSILA